MYSERKRGRLTMADKDIGVAGVLALRFKKGISDEVVNEVIEHIYLSQQDRIHGMNWFEFRNGVEGSYDFKKWIDKYEGLKDAQRDVNGQK
jgi:hypothetical protein